MTRVVIVIPAYNEEALLDETLATAVTFCDARLSAYDWRIVVADNGSTDQTGSIGESWTNKHPRVSCVLVTEQGKGAAVMAAWQQCVSDVYCFMDADLATDLSALPILIETIVRGSDLAIGSRFHKQSRVQRSAIRRVFSAGYRWLARIVLDLQIADLPCGFKAINQRARDEVLPLIENRKWFFDSELVIIATALKYKITEVPVVWAERRPSSSSSRVVIHRVVRQYMRELWRMRNRLVELKYKKQNSNNVQQ